MDKLLNQSELTGSMKTPSLKEHLEMAQKSLPREEAMRLAKRIRPIMRITSKGHVCPMTLGGIPKGKKVWIDGSRIFHHSYTFSYEYRQFYGDAKDLEKVAEITTYHDSGHPILVKPSVYEVLYQIPSDMRDKVVAFELYSPSTWVYDLYIDELLCHRLQCILYAGKMPSDIAEKEIIW